MQTNKVNQRKIGKAEVSGSRDSRKLFPVIANYAGENGPRTWQHGDLWDLEKRKCTGKFQAVYRKHSLGYIPELFVKFPSVLWSQYDPPVTRVHLGLIYILYMFMQLDSMILEQ